MARKVHHELFLPLCYYLINCSIVFFKQSIKQWQLLNNGKKSSRELFLPLYHCLINCSIVFFKQSIKQWQLLNNGKKISSRTFLAIVQLFNKLLYCFFLSNRLNNDTIEQLFK